MINDRSLFAYIGAAVTAGALMALPLPAQADSHVGTTKNAAQAGLTFPSTPDGGGGGGGEEKAPSAKKPRKEIRKHRRIRHVVQRPRKHHEHFVRQPQPREHVKVSIQPEHGGGGGHRHHWGHHGHHHNNHFTDDLYRTRHLRKYHSHHEAREALIRDARRWFHHVPAKAHPQGVKGHDAVRVVRKEPSAHRDGGRKGQ
ncbi:hypothetical protein GCM10022226_12070 [Sphaerisporangium flaviroseum]|uniref:Uncharacterized protein n=1 Tax=Sphaerisporangium flaviroseum TaxID=509199 RepID=A0ABP7HKS6_9ACTN